MSTRVRDTLIYLGAFLLSLIGVTMLGMVWDPSPAAAQGRAPIACGSSAPISGATPATASIAIGTTAAGVTVCGFVFNGAGATTVKLVKGLGATCGTSTADLTGAMKLVDGSEVAYGGGTGAIIRLAPLERLCWVNSGSVQVSGVVTYGLER